MKQNPLANYNKEVVDTIRKHYMWRNDHSFVAYLVNERLGTDLKENDVAIISLTLKNGWGRTKR